MQFLNLLHGVEIAAQGGNPDINGVEYDSRRVKPGNVFVAMRGESSDGNRFIDQAVAAGAVAVVTDADRQPGGSSLGEGSSWTPGAGGCGAPTFTAILRRSWGSPESPERTAKAPPRFSWNRSCALPDAPALSSGTIEYHVLKEVLPAPHTTPESLDLQRLFSEALAGGGSEVVMEVSSHALAQQRTYGIPFDVAVFTNLTRDHLDYHDTMDEYFAAKRLLFSGSGSPPPRVAVMNTDDAHGLQLVQFCRGRSAEVVTYGLGKADYSVSKVEITPKGTRFDLNAPVGSVSLNSPLIGRVNIYNILAAVQRRGREDVLWMRSRQALRGLRLSRKIRKSRLRPAIHGCG